jgi:uncharacterized damage-inducible protein DinB
MSGVPGRIPPTPPPGGRIDPPFADDEWAALQAWLDYHRATLPWKLEGLTDEQVRRPMVPSGTSLLGLVKHLAYVERNWFRKRFAGEPELPVPWTEEDPDADFRIEPGEATEEVLDFYRSECEHSRSIVAGSSPDDPAKTPGRHEGLTLRWIMLHMIEETARHNGHADIIRELIDGAVGD